MKTRITILIAAAALVAAFTLGANSGSGDRPNDVPPTRWISISPLAGLVVTADVGRSISRTRGDARVVGATLYVRTPNGWQAAAVENPVRGIPVSP